MLTGSNSLDYSGSGSNCKKKELLYGTSELEYHHKLQFSEFIWFTRRIVK